IEDHMLTITQGADLATVNYIGYLIGALIAVRYSGPNVIKNFLLSGLLGNAFITVTQCFTPQFELLLVLRLFNGITNGIVFVFAPPLLLEWLISQNKAHLSGLLYFGVGGGLLVGGLFVDSTSLSVARESPWIPVAIAAAALA